MFRQNSRSTIYRKNKQDIKRASFSAPVVSKLISLPKSTNSWLFPFPFIAHWPRNKDFSMSLHVPKPPWSTRLPWNTRRDCCAEKKLPVEFASSQLVQIHGVGTGTNICIYIYIRTIYTYYIYIVNIFIFLNMYIYNMCIYIYIFNYW